MAPVVSISFFRFGGIASRFWVFNQMALARFPLARTPDIGFHRLMGTGTGLGFRPKPNWGVWTILAVWPSEAVARARTADAPVWRRWRQHAAEDWTVFLNPISCRGAWGGDPAFPPDAPRDLAPGERLAVLTRASIRPGSARTFWSRVPKIEDALAETRSVRFHIGMGEIPWLHQVTFSIWDDPAEMAQFAHAGGCPHAVAAREAYDRNWFSEYLFARFAVAGWDGTWNGAAPLPPVGTVAPGGPRSGSAPKGAPRVNPRAG